MTDNIQLSLPLSESDPLKHYRAIYLIMGSYTNSDVDDFKIDKQLIGFDCPFSDSFLIASSSKDDLLNQINELYHSTDVPYGGTLPEILCDAQGELQLELYRSVYSNKFTLDSMPFSFGKENLKEFWKREHWHFQ